MTTASSNPTETMEGECTSAGKIQQIKLRNVKPPSSPKLGPKKVQKLATSVTSAGVIFITSACPSWAQATRDPCLPPDLPMTDLSPEVLTEYRAEIFAEFETYFSAISDHIACLDVERARALDEARTATETYTSLITTIPTAKDLP